MQPLTNFQARKASHDGFTSACKECLKARDAERYQREKTVRSARQKEYIKTPDGKAAHAKAVEKWKSENKVRRAAQVILGNAVRDGRVTPWPVCAMPECCSKPEAHHPDYDRPLDVVWLCPAHHKQAHALVKAVSY
jgi:hypothetical protein